MNSHWLNIVALLAALMIGYSVLNNRDSGGQGDTQQRSALLGYYIKDAIITETSVLGIPRIRFAASDVTQNLADNSVTLTAVRADYLWSSDPKDAAKNNRNHDRIADHGNTQHDNQRNNQQNHWVLNADQALIPGKTKSSTDRILLTGNVEAHNVDALHRAALNTQSLDLDMERRAAVSADPVRINIDDHTINGRGLQVDMEKNFVQLNSDVTLRLAQIKPAAIKDGLSGAPLLVPGDFLESERFSYSDNDIVLTKVRTKSEPFVSADQARAAGKDLANNQVVLRGAVRMELPKKGLITADVATVTVRNNRIVHAQLTGKPVNFQHQRKNSSDLIRGRGATIDYDLPTQTVRFLGEAWFSDGKYEVTSDAIEYNLLTEAAQGGQSKLIVKPREDTAATPTAAVPPPPK